MLAWFWKATVRLDYVGLESSGALVPHRGQVSSVSSQDRADSESVLGTRSQEEG